MGRLRGGMKVAARIGEGLRREIGRGRRPRVGDGSRSSTTLLSLNPLCGGGVPSSLQSLIFSFRASELSVVRGSFVVKFSFSFFLSFTPRKSGPRNPEELQHYHTQHPVMHALPSGAGCAGCASDLCVRASPRSPQPHQSHLCAISMAISHTCRACGGGPLYFFIRCLLIVLNIYRYGSFWLIKP